MAMLASTVRAFVDERCEDCDGLVAVRISKLWASYQSWCDAHGVKWPGTLEQFSSNLQAVCSDKHVGRPRRVEGEAVEPPGRPMAIYGLRLAKRKKPEETAS
jgi:phage/plasmid-associated DNA primase